MKLAKVKWVVAGVVCLMVAGIGATLYYQLVVNARVIEALKTFPDGEQAGRVMLLTLPDGKQLPVNNLREGNLVFVGADGPWWRAFKGEGAAVSLLIRGEILVGRAVVVLDKPAYTRDVFSRLRPKAPAWLPDWFNGRLVVITLD